MTDPYRDPGRTYAPWEHTQTRVDDDDLDKVISCHGDAGWELVAAIRIIPVNQDTVYYRLFFKRPK
jgi:hypothetical protein